MATIQASIQLHDGMSRALQSITRSMNIVINTLEAMQNTSGNTIDIAALQAARRELAGAEGDLNDINNIIDRVRRGQEDVNNQTRNGRNEAEGLKSIWGEISGIVGGIGAAMTVGAILKEADDYQAALNTVQSQTGMQGSNLEIAGEGMKNLYVDNMGDSWDDVAQSMSTVHQITRLTGESLEQTTRAGLLLRDTFGFDVTESIRAAAMMEEQFGIAGGQAYDLIVQGAQKGLNKNGDLLDTINEYSVQFKKLGFDSTEMFNMLVNGAQSGTFSVDKLGDTIKEFSIRAIDGSDTTKEGFKVLGMEADNMAARFSAGGAGAKQAFQDTINAISKMEDPIQRNIVGVNLFGTMWEDLGYEGVMALSNIDGSIQLTTDNLENLNRVKYNNASSALASLGRTINVGLAGVVGGAVESARKYINDFTEGIRGNISEVQSIIGYLGFAIGTVGSFFAENWSVIEPIIWGIVAALGMHLFLTKGIAAGTIIMTAYHAAQTFLSIGFGVLTGSTAAASAATFTYNSALYACPLTWIILLIMALIAIIYVVVAAFNKWKGTTVSATGIVAGVFAVLGAHIINQFVVPTWNMLAAFGNFIANLFNDPIAAVKVLFYDMAQTVIGYIANMAHAIEDVINKIPGVEVDITSGLDGFQDKIKAASDKVKSESEWKEYVKSMDYVDYTGAAKAGYDVGKGIEDKAKNAFDGIKDLMDGGGMQDTWEGIGNNTGDTAGNTAKMADSMDILDEELKYLRDAAEQEVINRFTLADLKIDVSNNNTLTTKTDFDDVNRQLGEITAEMLAVAAEGAYA